MNNNQIRSDLFFFKMLSILKRIVRTRRYSSSSFTFELPETSFETHKLSSGPNKTVSASKQELLELYKMMVQIRRLETASDQLYKSKLIRGFCHLSTGQEALAAGMEAAITRDDSIITAYRCHGFTLTRGASAKSILAELMGREAGCSKGKGGSMHMFAHEFYGGNGIVGAQVPVGAGIGLFCIRQRLHKSISTKRR